MIGTDAFDDASTDHDHGVISYIDGWIEDDVEEDNDEIFNEIISSFDEGIYS
ncbi:MAG: hypothetical protein ACI9PP_000278 [Halobacteriales archaeon]|jgi:hypothetical protein